jgi:glucokinase
MSPVTGPVEADAVWVGIDLGGTGTRVLVATQEGSPTGEIAVPTSDFLGDPVRRLVDVVRGLLPPRARVEGIGIGASGPVDLRTGLIANPDTLPAFTGIPLADELASALGAPAWIDNDAVVAGLAEVTVGGAAGYPSALCVTLGTGIGAVMIQGGMPVRAADGQHPEAGHIPVAGQGHPCYCGLSQCWEQVASRTALDAMAGSESRGPEVWSAYAARLAGGLVTLLTLYHPACVVIGGSVARWWPDLASPLRSSLSAYREADPALPILASDLGAYAGALGAVALARSGIGWRAG